MRIFTGIPARKRFLMHVPALEEMPDQAVARAENVGQAEEQP